MTSSEAGMGRRPSWREAAERRRRSSYLTVALTAMLVSLLFGVRAGYHMTHGGLRSVDFIMLFECEFVSFSSFVVLQGWTGRRPSRKERLLEDELTRAIRDRALQFGFLMLYASLLVVVAVAVWRPAWGLMLLPTLPVVGASAGLLRFVQLDRRAERGDV